MEEVWVEEVWVEGSDNDAFLTTRTCSRHVSTVINAVLKFSVLVKE